MFLLKRWSVGIVMFSMCADELLNCRVLRNTTVPAGLQDSFIEFSDSHRQKYGCNSVPSALCCNVGLPSALK